MISLTSQSPAWLCMLFACQLFSQNYTEIKINQQDLTSLSKVAQAVKDAKNSGASFKNIQALKLSSNQQFASRNSFGDKVKVLNVDAAVLRNLINEAPQQISLNVPRNSRENIKLQLIKVNPLADGFNVFTSGSQKEPFHYLPGIYYRGVVEGNETNSIATISIFLDEIIGCFTYEGGNMNIQPTDSGSGELILFNDKDKPEEFNFQCFSDQLDKVQKPIQPRGLTSSGDCVRVYIECDYALFQNKGGTSNTVNWITSVFNNIAALYANESINTTISEVFVWTTADSYSKTNSVDALNQFKSARPTFNGDIAHLAALGGNNLGGVAWVDVLCSSFKYAYSNISSSYSTAPTYSWTVEVMTHEMGHSLGSNHTQWCGWNGGALDNCYTTEGGCSPGPAPTNGGTIMSYCHLTSYGINFNNGFGPQPGDKIRAQVAAATCLNSSCSGGGGGCANPTGLAISNITQTTATANWNAVSGATSYSFEYKINSGSTWTVVNTSSTNSNLSGLVSNTLYNTRVKATCSSGASIYSATVNFTTSGGGSCGVPSNFAASNITQSTATISWTAVAGASSYNFQYKLASGSTWTQVNLATTSANLTGMSASTSYSVRVQAVCGTSQSDFSPVVTFTTLAGYCISKGQSTNYEWIKRVKLGSIDRTSAGDGGYFNATNLVANLFKGSTNTINYQCGSTGSSGVLYWKIWIDFNNNNSFEDAGENIVSNATSSTGLLSSTFTIPANAVTANVRMRVAMKYGGYATPCLTFSYGEVEDYTINIQSPSGSCDIPGGLNINNIGKTTSTVSWNSVAGASSYNFEYKLNTESNWTVINSSTTSINLSGLTINSLYNTRVKSICTSGTSEYCAVINFTTLNESCGIPTNLNASEITKSTATVNWNAVAEAISYSFEYKLNSESNWTSITKTSTSHNLTGLIPGTLYNIRVKSNCTFGTGEYAAIVNFTTLNESCEIPANLNVTEITKTTATAHWNVVSGAISYSFEYKPNSESVWTPVSKTTTDHNLGGLIPGTLYNTRVKSTCASGTSQYSSIVNFTTQNEICEIPANLNPSNISQNGATLSWNPVSGASSYNLEYKQNSESTWTVINTTSTLYNLSGLTENTLYDVRIKTICAFGPGEYAITIHFTTTSSGSCGIPINLSVSNLGPSKATVLWNAIGGAISYNVQYKLTSGDNWSTINVATNSVNLTGLTTNTSYNVHVQAICGSGQSAYSSSISFNTPAEYCISKGLSTNYEWIKRVILGTIDRSSGKDGGYFNGTSLSTNVEKGVNYTVSYQCGSTGSSGTLYWRIWIDYNNNNSFEDPGEMVVSVASPSTALLSSNFTVPAGAATGNVRMRVAMKYGGYSTPCLSFNYGEVEDYTINIQGTGGFVDPNAISNRIENVNLFPNPFSREFNLDLYANQDQEIQMTILDQLGKVYLSKPLHALTGNNRFHIESAEFIPGSYSIQIKSANNTYLRKMVKLEK